MDDSLKEFAIFIKNLYKKIDSDEYKIYETSYEYAFGKLSGIEEISEKFEKLFGYNPLD